MDQWSSFLSDRWYIVLIALLVLILVIKMVKTVIKWVLVLLVAAAVLYLGYNYQPETFEKLTKSVTATVSETIKDQAIKLMTEEAKEASYKDNGDGSFTISTKNIRVDGKAGAKEVKVTVIKLKQSIQLKTETVKVFIEQASKNK